MLEEGKSLMDEIKQSDKIVSIVKRIAIQGPHYVIFIPKEYVDSGSIDPGYFYEVSFRRLNRIENNPEEDLDVQALNPFVLAEVQKIIESESKERWGGISMPSLRKKVPGNMSEINVAINNLLGKGLIRKKKALYVWVGKKEEREDS